MPHRPFSNDALDALRKVGDPELEMHEDEDPGRYFAEVAANGLLAALDASSLTKVVLDAAQEGAHEAVNRLKSYGVDPNPAIQRAHDRFAYYGDEICAALLLAALPATYATAWGSRVLVAHGDLVWALPRRVRETAIFLTTVMANGRTADGENDDPVATIVRTSAALRLFHHMVRAQLEQDEEAMHAIRAGVGRAGDKPINQEDLLGTLLTFSVTTFDALDQFG